MSYKYKYGDLVTISTELPFFKGAQGRVVDVERKRAFGLSKDLTTEYIYVVQLAYSTENFREVHLMEVKNESTGITAEYSN
jgi:hypothetical protein